MRRANAPSTSPAMPRPVRGRVAGAGIGSAAGTGRSISAPRTTSGTGVPVWSLLPATGLPGSAGAGAAVTLTVVAVVDGASSVQSSSPGLSSSVGLMRFLIVVVVVDDDWPGRLSMIVVGTAMVVGVFSCAVVTVVDSVVGGSATVVTVVDSVVGGSATVVTVVDSVVGGTASVVTVVDSVGGGTARPGHTARRAAVADVGAGTGRRPVDLQVEQAGVAGRVQHFVDRQRALLPAVMEHTAGVGRRVAGGGDAGHGRAVDDGAVGA